MQKRGRKSRRKKAPEKTGKSRLRRIRGTKPTQTSRWYGGLPGGPGRVRKGNPSEYGEDSGQLLRGGFNTQVPGGYGEFKPLREIAVPQKNPGE